MAGTAEDAHKCCIGQQGIYEEIELLTILGGDVHIQDAGREQTAQSDTVANALHKGTGTAKGR